jgi:hypothetical protein
MNENAVRQVEEIYRFPRSDAERSEIIRKTQWIAVQKPPLVSPNAYQVEIELILVQVLNEQRLPEQPQRQALGLTTTVQGCKDSVARLRRLGITAGAHYGNARPEHENLREFKKGKIQVLLICGKLLEGFDYSKVSVCAFLNVTSSIVRFSQFSGRCIRIDRNLPIEHEAILIGPEELTPFYERMANEDTQALPKRLPVEDPADDPDEHS